MSRENPFTISVKPAWRDMDALGHVNNAVYLTYLENARAAYWRAFHGAYDLFPFILAKVSIDFRAPSTWRDLLTVAIWIERVGNSSFDFHYRIENDAGELVAEAMSVLVMYDFAAKKAIAIPAEARKKLEDFERNPPKVS